MKSLIESFYSVAILHGKVERADKSLRGCELISDHNYQARDDYAPRKDNVALVKHLPLKANTLITQNALKLLSDCPRN